METVQQRNKFRPLTIPALTRSIVCYRRRIVR
jgi:hypothetical protein